MSGSPFSWTCAYCGKPQIANENNSSDNFHFIPNRESEHGAVGLQVTSAACLDKDCKKLTLIVTLMKSRSTNYGPEPGSEIETFRLLPSARTTRIPPSVPIQIRQDFEEACRIVELSPKASATLARRALQGMIRDFAKISKARLIDEIRELRITIETGNSLPDVSPQSVDAIDQLRKIGNIGAHMEADINLIIDIEPNEAHMLLDLVESLFEDWYVARETRRIRFKALTDIAESKTEQKQLQKPTQPK